MLYSYVYSSPGGLGVLVVPPTVAETLTVPGFATAGVSNVHSVEVRQST
jgi:hypothetical protein